MPLIACFPVFIRKLEHEEVLLDVVSDMEITFCMLLTGNGAMIAAVTEGAQILEAGQRI